MWKVDWRGDECFLSFCSISVSLSSSSSHDESLSMLILYHKWRDQISRQMASNTTIQRRRRWLTDSWRSVKE